MTAKMFTGIRQGYLYVQRHRASFNPRARRVRRHDEAMLSLVNEKGNGGMKNQKKKKKKVEVSVLTCAYRPPLLIQIRP